VKRFATFRAELINPSRARALNSRSNADSSIKLDHSRASNVIRRLPILSTPVDRQDRWRRRRKRERSSRVSIIARDAVRCIARVKARDGRDGLSRWTVMVRFILLYAQSRVTAMRFRAGTRPQHPICQFNVDRVSVFAIPHV